MHKTKEEAFRQLNFDLVVTRAEKLMEQRNELVEQLYGHIPLEPSEISTEEYTIGDIIIVKEYAGVFVGKVTAWDNEYVTLSSCMKIVSCNMGTTITEMENPEKFSVKSILKVF